MHLNTIKKHSKEEGESGQDKPKKINNFCNNIFCLKLEEKMVRRNETINNTIKFPSKVGISESIV